jgi:hypothetical protein
VVRGPAKDSTKTYLVRDIELSDRACAAIEAQRVHTQLAGKEIVGTRPSARRGPTSNRSGEPGNVA